MNPPKYKEHFSFNYHNDGLHVSIQDESDELKIGYMVEVFESFLRAAGFCFGKINLEK